MKHYGPLLMGIALAASACGGGGDTAVPALQLTTTTSTTQVTTTSTSVLATTTTGDVTTTSATEQPKFDPETAQAEIQALIEEFEDLWSGENISFDPDDPRLDRIYTGEQLGRVRDVFARWADAGQKIDGITIIKPYPPAILYEASQSAVITACSLDGVALLNPDGTSAIEADQDAFEHAFEFAYQGDMWRIALNGKPNGEDYPCDL